MTTAFFVLSALCMILSIVALLFSLNAIIDVKALQKSTHSVIMKPPEAFDDSIDDIWDETQKEVTEVIEKSEDAYLGLIDDEPRNQED